MALRLRIIRRLRPGWTRYEVVRQTGVDRYFKAPAGHVICSYIKASIYAVVLEYTDDADLAFDAIDCRGLKDTDDADLAFGAIDRRG
jgi:hypothetical protein